MKAFTAILLASVCGLGLVGCGGQPETTAVAATERNSFSLDGLRYRVAMFRQLNPRLAPDRALYEGLPVEGNAGVFAAFLVVCNEGDAPRTPTGRLRLEDAFGEAYPRVPVPPDEALGYRPEPIAPGRCFPSEDSTADQALPGAAAVFEVPFDALTNRPFVLEVSDAQGGSRRVELDL